MSLSTSLFVEITEVFTIAFAHLKSTNIFGPMSLSTSIGFHMQIRSLPEQIMTKIPNSLVCTNITWHVKNLELYNVHQALSPQALCWQKSVSVRHHHVESDF